MVNLVPTCARCGSPVTDSLDPNVEEQGQLKRGKYINSVWMCNECKEAQGSGRGEQKLGTASSADVSPNTPRADEANL